MTNVVQLNNIDHGDLRIATDASAAFGDGVNQALVFPNEFEDAARDYPILFRADEGGGLQAVVLLGLDPGENLFLGDGVWQARYVPALHARGPFSIGIPRSAEGETGEPMIHVDLDHPRVGAAAGQPVFLPHGGNAPYIEGIAAVLRTIHEGVTLAPRFFALLDALDLITSLRVEVSLSETEQYTLPDFAAIDQARFAALDGGALAQLNAAGLLRPAAAAMASLGNVNRLIDLKNRRRTDD